MQAEKKTIAEEKSLNSADHLKDIFIEGVDFSQGIERFSNKHIYLEMIRSYCLHTPPLLEKLRTLSRDDTGISLAEYALIIHGIKGSSYSIFAASVAEKAETLEEAAKAGDFEQVFSENISFIQTTESLLADLGELFEKTITVKTKHHSPAPDSVLLSRLSEAAKQFRTDQMEKILMELESFEYESGNDLVIWLRKQLDNLEYDLLLERLESIQTNLSI